MYPNADLNTEENMTISKDPISEEVANISEQGKSPATLAKTKDGSTFAAKARAAELKATRARKAEAEHAHLLTDYDVDYDDPPVAPVPLGSFKFTRSRARASNACTPPNKLTELPEVTAENKVKSPSPQHYSLQLLQRPSFPHQNLNQSTSCLDPPQLPVIQYPGSGKVSVSTEKPSVANWQTELILKSSPHHHKSLKFALGHTLPTLQRPTQDLDPSQVPVPPSSHIDGSSVSVERQSAADRQGFADRSFELTIAPIPRRSLPQASPTINKHPGDSKASVSTDKPSVVDWQTEVILTSSPHHQHTPLKHALGYTQPSLQRPTQSLDPVHVPTPLSAHIDGTSASAGRQGIANWPFKPATAPIPHQTHVPTPPSAHIDGTSASAARQGVADWPFEPAIAPIPRGAHVPTAPSTHIDRTSAPADRHSAADRQSVADRSFELTIAPTPCRSLPQASPTINSFQPPDSTPPSTHIDKTFASADRQGIADWPFEPTIALIPRPSLRQASHTINNLQPPGSLLRAHDADHAAFNLNPADLSAMPPFYGSFGVPRGSYTGGHLRYGGYQNIPATRPSPQWLGFIAAISATQDPNIVPGSPMNPRVAQNIVTTLGSLTFNELMVLSDQAKVQVNTAQSALGQPLTDWDLFSTNRKAGDSTAKMTPRHIGTRDPNAYTNPQYMQHSSVPDPPRTVAHDPLARPSITKEASPTARSTLKPEAAIYTPRSAGDNEPQPRHSTAESSPGTAAAGNIAMAKLVKQRKKYTLEEAVESFRTNSMDKDFQAVKNQIDAMTASLASNSFPENGISRHSLGMRLPRPIGYGRPRRADTTPTPAPVSSKYDDMNDNMNKKGGSGMLANTITNLLQHKNPVPHDYAIRYRDAHACEVDQGPEGNKSLFDPKWGTPPSRVARDPRRMQQGGSGGASGAFGRR